MENQSNSRAKKPPKDIAQDGDEQHHPKEQKTRNSSCVFSDLEIRTQQDNSKLSLSSNLIKNQTLNYLSKHNLNSALSILAFKKTLINEINSYAARPSMSSAKKIELYFQKISKKKHVPFIKNLCNQLHDDALLFDINSESSNINNFLKKLASLSFFKQFESIQLLFHEKGKNEAESHVFSGPDSYSKKMILASSFVTALQFIKKSKNKNFQNKFTNSPFESIGPFSAREFEFNEFSVIAIFARNGFLPISDEEYEYLDSIYFQLKSLVKNLIQRSQFSDGERALINSLTHFPKPIAVMISNNVIFKNKSLLHFSLDKSQRPKVIPFGTDKVLHIWNSDYEDTVADLGHHQRIRLLGELLNTLKHELSNPLFGLSLSSQCLVDSVSNNERKEYLKSINQSTNRCNEIISNFSGFYIEENDSSPIAILKLINEVLTLTKSETRGITKKIKYNDPSIAEDLICTNPTLLSQVLFNLVINGAQALAGKTIEPCITISLHKSQSHLAIEVSDNGPEIPEENLENIFRPFFTTKHKGTGLGLAICKNLVSRLGGQLTCKRNRPFPGLTFSLVLPY